jgi:hypothetical protein
VCVCFDHVCVVIERHEQHIFTQQVADWKSDAAEERERGREGERKSDAAGFNGNGRDLLCSLISIS